MADNLNKDYCEFHYLIFDLYLQGKSIVGIMKELENRGIKSPTGKDVWSKRTIDVMLSNEKYIGVVRLLDKGNHEVHYVSKDNYSPIISKEKFQAVQAEKINRSNIVKGVEGSRRKSKKYSSKK